MDSLRHCFIFIIIIWFASFPQYSRILYLIALPSVITTLLFSVWEMSTKMTLIINILGKSYAGKAQTLLNSTIKNKAHCNIAPCLMWNAITLPWSIHLLFSVYNGVSDANNLGTWLLSLPRHYFSSMKIAGISSHFTLGHCNCFAYIWQCPFHQKNMAAIKYWFESWKRIAWRTFSKDKG